MSIPTTFEALLIIALIFVPGIIFGQVIRAAIAYFPGAVDFRHFLAMGATGLFLHAVLFPFGTRWVVTWYIDQTLDEHWVWTYIWLLFAIFLFPVAAGIAVSKIVRVNWIDRQLDKVGMSYVDRTASAWDFAVRDRDTKWVRIHFKDGRDPVNGWFGLNSFASMYSPRKDIYLEEMWLLDDDGTFVEKRVNTDGVWISYDVISHIEFQIGVEHA